jgi:hypothetical protein
MAYRFANRNAPNEQNPVSWQYLMHTSRSLCSGDSAWWRSDAVKLESILRNDFAKVVNWPQLWLSIVEF